MSENSSEHQNPQGMSVYDATSILSDLTHDLCGCGLIELDAEYYWCPECRRVVEV